MDMNPFFRGLVAVLASTGMLAGCQTSPQAPKETYVAKADPDGVQRVRLAAGSYFFRPNHIVVRVGVPVELVASREAGMTPHDLVIRAPESGVDVQQDLGTEPRSIRFTPTKPGRYAIHCSKKPPFGSSHRERGMEGVLEVVP